MRILIMGMYKNIFRFLVIVFLFLTVGNTTFAQEKELKVITYNIWNGFDWGNDTVRNVKLVNWVREQKADIVALQELCNYTPEKLEEDAKAWGHNYSVLLKETGYSVGLTSKYLIKVKEKILDGMHHGALHCETTGIDVFVIHFWPGNYKYREEIAIITERLKKVREETPYYIVLGDFNAHSPIDADLYNPNGYLFSRKKSFEKDNINIIDYEAMSSLLAFPLVDVCQLYTKGMSERGTFPGRVLGPLNNETSEQLISRLERIDYILTSPELAKKCVNANVCNSKENWFLSDHYPVVCLLLWQ
ncbi:MAG: endonuclease/exonuclease/phosphatase family protein [Bacteroidota bacterium]